MPPTALADDIRSLPGYDPHATAGDSRFDEARAAGAVLFFERELKHVEGAKAGQPFLLEPWQRGIIGNLFGWRRTDEQGRDVRRYREAFIFVPRKNGKTPLAAGICLLVLFGDGEPGAQIYSAAAEREQAALLFRHARGMVDRSPRLSKRATVYAGIGQRSIALNDDRASVYKVLSADADTKHGGNSHLVIVDELHAQPNRDLVDVLQTSMASANRKQPMLVHITTAGFDRNSICWEKYDYACKVRDGIISDPSFLPVIYEAGDDDDWTSEATWAKANPNLGVSVSLDYLRRECKRAQESPAYQNTFRRLHLNQWTQQDVRWLDMVKWDACGEPFDPAELEGEICYAGLDLATTTDIAALSLVFQRDGVVYVLPFFWVPEENARQREQRDRVPYATWARDGFVEATPGNVIDYDTIRTRVNELAKQYNIRNLAIDRWNATQITTQLQGDGLKVEFFGQGFASMTAPTKELDRLVADGRLRHNGHPVLRWMASNVAVEQDSAGNMKPSKKKSTERIDGIVSTIMGIGRLIATPEKKPSIYASYGNLSL